MAWTLDDFDYPLPQELIAQAPLDRRTDSRLLQVGPQLADLHFADLPTLLAPGDLLVFNDTRVIHARLFGTKDTGGQVEVMIERPLGAHEALAQIRASKSPKPGTRLMLEGALEVEVLGRAGEFFHLRFPAGEDLVVLLERHGRLPLPPYIERAAGNADESRYQTVFAKNPGSVAAPTAGLHLTPELIARAVARGVEIAHATLHVGPGTFKPVSAEDLDQHEMHAEEVHVSDELVDAVARARARGAKVVAVGTTVVRALESARDPERPGQVRPLRSETRLLIQPGYAFGVVDALLTNFHMPRSTLLALVAAFAGLEPTRRAYREAVRERYRFLSYGDAMWIPARAKSEVAA